MTKLRLLILGAAGRDFHNFNLLYRDNDAVEVVGFTATQIPRIEGRKYPPELAGKLYPNGLNIWSEDEVEKLIVEHKVQKCIFSYSDLPHRKISLLGARCLAAGADFELLEPWKTMVASCKPVIAVTAVRTGCGKSQTSRYIVEALKKLGKTAVVVRHPMPYGDLAKQAVQRFANYDDLTTQQVTLEEREEYEQHIDQGTVVYAGVDYEPILRQAEQEADVVIWDGGNNDTPFYKPDLWIAVSDPLRAGNELNYYPGDINFRCAGVITINKANSATLEAIDQLKKAAAELNPRATVVVTNSRVEADHPELVEGKRVVIVDDGPTLTHGEMKFGAGEVAAKEYGAAEIVDPRPCFKGSMLETYKRYPDLGPLIPAMGYYAQQVKDLEETINACDCDTIVIGTPMDLRKIVNINKPATQVKYNVTDRPGEKPVLSSIIEEFVKEHVPREP